MYFLASAGCAKCQESSGTLTIANLCHPVWQLPKQVAINGKYQILGLQITCPACCLTVNALIFA
jgi:hypothetical protein